MVAEIERRIRAELTAELAAERARLEAERVALARQAAEQERAHERRRKALTDRKTEIEREEARLRREKQAIAAKRRATRLAISDLAIQREAWQTTSAAERARLEQIRSETETARQQAADRLQTVEIEARALEADIAAKRRLLAELEAATERQHAMLPDPMPTESSGLLASLDEGRLLSNDAAKPGACDFAASELVAFAECVLDAEARMRDERRRWEAIERGLERDRQTLDEGRTLFERQQRELQDRKARLANAELAFQRKKLQIERALDAREFATRQRDLAASASGDSLVDHWHAERDQLQRTIASLRAEVEHLAAALVLGIEPDGNVAPARSAA